MLTSALGATAQYCATQNYFGEAALKVGQLPLIAFLIKWLF